jgi:hypothetical protein
MAGTVAFLELDKNHLSYILILQTELLLIYSQLNNNMYLHIGAGIAQLVQQQTIGWTARVCFSERERFFL